MNLFVGKIIQSFKKKKAFPEEPYKAEGWPEKYFLASTAEEKAELRRELAQTSLTRQELWIFIRSYQSDPDVMMVLTHKYPEPPFSAEDIERYSYDEEVRKAIAKNRELVRRASGRV